MLAALVDAFSEWFRECEMYESMTVGELRALRPKGKQSLVSDDELISRYWKVKADLPGLKQNEIYRRVAVDLRESGSEKALSWQRVRDRINARGITARACP